ncbi:MAG: hypothetical protein JWP95_215 [Actinotalea sp.]|nr:hypothetical protein [Actinotalea sp.]
MRVSTRSTAAAVLALLTLSGCGLVGGPAAPERDDAGEIVQSADSDPFALRVGDCLSAADLTELVESVPTVPCGETHDSEVYAVTDVADGEYPGDDAIAAQADEFCYTEFATFIGMSYEESEIYLNYLTPTEQSWNELNDRELLCFATDEAGVTGTMKGAAR